MERGFSSVCVDDIWYITTHLESMDTAQSATIRQQQLAEMWTFIADKSQIVIGMDSNINGEIKCPNGFDVWENDDRFDRFIAKNCCVNEKFIIKNVFSDHDMLFVNMC